MFPAKKLLLCSEIDGWFVRTGAQDDPEAGLSAFAVEMTDIKVALRDATSKSFLLIDELGKGTESQAGHAIAASVLEHLVSRKIRSIFATHWHEIFANQEVNLDKAKLIKMQCQGNEPIYKVEDGVDLRSSAFYTALKIGVDCEIIDRAQEISKGYGRSAILEAENQIPNIIEKSNDLVIKILLASSKDNQIVKKLEANQIAPLKDIGYSIVYILKTPNNFFYAGETDNFLHRVKAHRSRLFSNECEFFYIVVKEGKSEARRIEQEIIVKLKNSGLPMLSVADESNVNFGVG